MKFSNIAIIGCLSLTLLFSADSSAIQPIDNHLMITVEPQTSANDGVITAEALLAKLTKEEPVLVLDVRTEGQYKSSGQRIKGDVRIEKEEEIDTKLKGVPPDRFIVTYCTCPDEATSSYYVAILKRKGFKNAHALKGGYYAWLRIDGPTEGR